MTTSGGLNRPFNQYCDVIHDIAIILGGNILYGNGRDQAEREAYDDIGTTVYYEHAQQLIIIMYAEGITFESEDDVNQFAWEVRRACMKQQWT